MFKLSLVVMVVLVILAGIMAFTGSSWAMYAVAAGMWLLVAVAAFADEHPLHRHRPTA